MPSPSRIDLETLFNPISEDIPTGPDARENASPTSNYQTIKTERNQARAAERQSVHDGESNEASTHWRKITELAPQIINSESKDLEVASWYAEAMLRRFGFGGLRDAFKLIEGLIDGFWDTLHPMPDEYGMETRVSCLSGLNGEGAEGVLIAPIRKVSLTEDDEMPGPFSLWQYKQAIDAQKSPDEQTRKNKIDQLGFSVDDIQKYVDHSSDEFITHLRDDLVECVELYRSIGRKLDEVCGIQDAPPTSTIVGVLEETLGVVKHLGKNKLFEEPETTEEETHETVEAGDTSAKVKHAKGPIQTREDAFNQLLDIAEYFRKSEPHSPVSYLLQKAVKWGRMSLNDLISELIPDSGARDKYSELTGVSDDSNQQ